MAKNDTPQNNILKLCSAIGFELSQDILISFIQEGVKNEFEKYKNLDRDNSINNYENVTPIFKQDKLIKPIEYIKLIK